MLVPARRSDPTHSSTLNSTTPRRSGAPASSRGRLALFTLLYASEGAPIGFIWWSLPTLLRERGGGVGRQVQHGLVRLGDSPGLAGVLRMD